LSIIIKELNGSRLAKQLGDTNKSNDAAIRRYIDEFPTGCIHGVFNRNKRKRARLHQK
jgi:hypothetical protein